MKLLQHQYQDIIHTLNEFNINTEKLSLVKKKGRIKISIEGVDPHFEFFRRKSVSLTPIDHQWQKSEHYELNISGSVASAADWGEVVSQFRKWLLEFYA